MLLLAKFILANFYASVGQILSDDWTASGSCPVSFFGNSGVEPSRFSTHCDETDGFIWNEVLWEITHRCAACGFRRIKAIPPGTMEREDPSNAGVGKVRPAGRPVLDDFLKILLITRLAFWFSKLIEVVTEMWVFKSLYDTVIYYICNWLRGRRASKIAIIRAPIGVQDMTSVLIINNAIFMYSLLLCKVWSFSTNNY